jgi:hypothetical protein
LRWHYGDGLQWTVRMIVLTLEPGEAEKLAEGGAGLQRKYGMPIDPAPYARTASSEAACRAVVAARLHAPSQVEPLLRRLRVRVMKGGLLDEPSLIEGAAVDAGIDRDALAEWVADAAVEAALQADIAAARDPSPAARALDHKLGGPPDKRRYTAPTYLIEGFAIPGFNPIEVYETAIANLLPELPRRSKPEAVLEVLEWAPEPLATSEVAMLMQTSIGQTRAALEQVGRFEPAGADGYWTLS